MGSFQLSENKEFAIAKTASEMTEQSFSLSFSYSCAPYDTIEEQHGFTELDAILQEGDDMDTNRQNHLDGAEARRQGFFAKGVRKAVLSDFRLGR